ncbi:hypothetical protein [uncultured Erythrobacter sp.]|uniref:hypothetical protein n=1 Tax=uncultured Erythrobacter sp. TaxID=263913 RepID=UPI00260C4CA2|nr:hypothetical protein [uncultured Erythrobacter sp.]
MVFISPSFAKARLSSAECLSLVLGTNNYEYDFIVSDAGGPPTAILLNGDHSFTSFLSGAAHNHAGIIIKDISFEVDLDTNPGRDLTSSPPGALVRKSCGLYIRSTPQAGIQRYGHCEQLVAGLGECAENEAVSYTRWAVVHGKGRDKKVLYSIDVSPKASGS